MSTIVFLLSWIIYSVYSPTCQDLHSDDTSVCDITLDEMKEYAVIYGATVEGTGGEGSMAPVSNDYPNYEERYIHHHWNIVRYDCVAFCQLGYTYATAFHDAVETIVCPSSAIDKWPTEPVHIHPRLIEAARFHSHDLVENSCGLQHECCDGTSTWDRINSFLKPACSGGGEILWSPIDYRRAVDGWLCESSSSSGCYVGGHTKITMSKSYKLGAPGVERYINGDWSSCNIFDRNEVPIHSGIWKTNNGESKFMAMFYGPNLTDISGVVVVGGHSYPLSCDIQRDEFPGSGHYSVELEGIATDCTVKFNFVFTATYDGTEKQFYYPSRGVLFVGEKCDPQYESQACREDCSLLENERCDESAEEPVCICTSVYKRRGSTGVCDCECYNGDCSSGSCVCDQGWKGSKCDEQTCYYDCGSHGSCDEESSPIQCKCDDGYQGDECDEFYCGEKGCVHGLCTGPNTCTCYNGYTGEHCDLIGCDGILYNDSTVCNGHGICENPDTCACEEEYNGVFCKWKIVPDVTCYGLDSSDPYVCSSRGGCIDDDTCKCDNGFFGDEEENYCQNKRTCFGVDFDNKTGVCSGRGECIDVDLCDCPTLYSTLNIYEAYVGEDCGTELIGSPQGIASLSLVISLGSISFVILIIIVIAIVILSLIKTGSIASSSNKKTKSKEKELSSESESSDEGPEPPKVERHAPRAPPPRNLVVPPRNTGNATRMQPPPRMQSTFNQKKRPPPPPRGSNNYY